MDIWENLNASIFGSKTTQVVEPTTFIYKPKKGTKYMAHAASILSFGWITIGRASFRRLYTKFQAKR